MLYLLLALGCDTASKPVRREAPAAGASSAGSARSAAPLVVAPQGDRWEFTIASEGGDPPLRIVPLRDGGWALAGSRPPPLNLGGQTFHGQPHLVYVGVFDAVGKHRFSTEVAQSGGQTFGDLIEAPDGDLILAADINGSSVSVLGKHVSGEGPLVARFSPQGVLRWAQMEGGARSDPNPRRARNARLTVTPAGDIYVAYHLGPASQQSQLEARAGVVLCRLGAGGSPLWTTEILDRGFWTETFLRPHPAGGVIIAGNSDGDLNWESARSPSPAALNPSPAAAPARALEGAAGFGLFHRGAYGGGPPNLFVARFDDAGELVWHQSEHARHLKFGKAYDVSVGQDGSSWFAIGGTGKLSLKGQTLTTNDWDLIVLRVSPEGQWLPPIHLRRPAAQGRGRLLRRGQEAWLFGDSAGPDDKRSRVGFRLAADGSATKLKVAGAPLLGVASQGGRLLLVSSPEQGGSRGTTLPLVVERSPWPTSAEARDRDAP